MYYLLGEKLKHSYSCEIHAAFGRYDYALKEIAPDALGDFLLHGAYEGLNVTIPYKTAVIPYLDEIDDAARKTGAVNTVVRRDGRLIGYNTDYYGFFAMAHRADISFRDKKVLIFGTGGTSLTAQAVARDMGAREVCIVSRKGPLTYEMLAHDHHDAQILVNTTPVGMYPNNGALLPVDLSRFPYLEGVLDVIYNPLRTRLIAEAEERDLKTSGGLYMLVVQGTMACAHFTGEKLSPTEIENVYLSLLRNKANISLVGMPGCGKSSVARALGALSGREVVETDDEIVRRAGCSIPEIFEQRGEEGFRALEEEVIREVGARAGIILSSGGGAPTREANRYAMMQNGRVYFLLRPISELSRDGRPLSQGADLDEMYRRRLPDYLAACDRSLECAPIDELARQIWEDFHAHPYLKRT